MKFGVIIFPGTNCDYDTYWALKKQMGVSVDFLWHKDTDLNECDCVILPGGFAYGDYMRTGAIARFSPIMASVINFAHKGGLVLGICNGFQILMEAALLPGAMLRNKGLKFICDYVNLRVEENITPFTNACQKGEVLKIPIAHNEGNYYVDNDTLKKLKSNGQITLRYCSPNGELRDDANPNGALDAIAGIRNQQGNVMGLMPHPERCCEALLGSQDGKKIFQSIINWIKKGCA
jgi:phosphoribosylformylglycinamidine synthase I